MTGFVDLHCHVVPGVDDGSPDVETSREMLRGMKRLGWSAVCTTPHIRDVMFPNEPVALRAAFEALVAELAGDDSVPALRLGAEHHADDRFLGLIEARSVVTFPGGRVALVELPNERMPRGLEALFFAMQRIGVHPLIAHPERYAYVFQSSDAIEHLADSGAQLQLDVMSLVGKYGAAPQRAAERLLDEGLYSVAASDLHRVADLEDLAGAIERLRELLGHEGAEDLLAHAPRELVDVDE